MGHIKNRSQGSVVTLCGNAVSICSGLFRISGVNGLSSQFSRTQIPICVNRGACAQHLASAPRIHIHLGKMIVQVKDNLYGQAVVSENQITEGNNEYFEKIVAMP